MFFQPPFEPTEIEAVAILNVGFMFADIVILLFLLILMIYLYKKIESNLPIIVVYLFSLMIGIEGLGHFHTHFSPMFEIFFLLFQTSIFVMKGLDVYIVKKKAKNRRGY